jgi:hypothetical protein
MMAAQQKHHLISCHNPIVSRQLPRRLSGNEWRGLLKMCKTGEAIGT